MTEKILANIRNLRSLLKGQVEATNQNDIALCGDTSQNTNIILRPPSSKFAEDKFLEMAVSSSP